MAEREDENWWKPHAKCLGMPPSFFFPVVRDPLGMPVTNKSGGEKPDLDGVQKAKRFCLGINDGFECPVRMECLHWAIVHEQWEGVYGGMVERERRKYARRKRAGAGFGSSVESPTTARPI